MLGCNVDWLALTDIINHLGILVSHDLNHSLVDYDHVLADTSLNKVCRRTQIESITSYVKISIKICLLWYVN